MLEILESRFEHIKVEMSGAHYQPDRCSTAHVVGIIWDKDEKRPCVRLSYENGKEDFIPLSELGRSHILGSVTILNGTTVREAKTDRCKVTKAEDQQKRGDVLAWVRKRFESYINERIADLDALPVGSGMACLVRDARVTDLEDVRINLARIVQEIREGK